MPKQDSCKNCLYRAVCDEPTQVCEYYFDEVAEMNREYSLYRNQMRKETNEYFCDVEEDGTDGV